MYLFGYDGSVLLSVVAHALLLYISCVQVRIFLFLAMLTRATSGRFKLMRAELRIETHPRLKEAEEGIPL
jgi:hypothetical protein